MANKKTLTPTSLPASLTLPQERKTEKALLFHAIQPTLAGWRVHPNDKHHKYQ